MLADAKWDIAYALRALPGNEYCGDALDFWWENNNLFLALADGLGHGFPAHYSAQEGLLCLRANSGLSILERIECCNETLRNTRGIALGLAQIIPEMEQATFIGIGNIRAVVLNQNRRRWLVCGHGIVGGDFQPPFIEQFPYTPGNIIILTSDGIAENFNRALDPALNAQTQAETLLNNYALARDDAAVLVGRWINHNIAQSLSEKI